jgi:hypothetical protein
MSCNLGGALLVVCYSKVESQRNDTFIKRLNPFLERCLKRRIDLPNSEADFYPSKECLRRIAAQMRPNQTILVLAYCLCLLLGFQDELREARWFLIQKFLKSDDIDLRLISFNARRVSSPVRSKITSMVKSVDKVRVLRFGDDVAELYDWLCVNLHI